MSCSAGCANTAPRPPVGGARTSSAGSRIDGASCPGSTGRGSGSSWIFPAASPDGRRSCPTNVLDRRAHTVQVTARHRVTLIPGDGIGPEVLGRRRLVLDAAVPAIQWVERDSGLRGPRGARRPAARGDPRGDPRLEGRDQGTDHDPRGVGIPQHQRRAPPGAGPVRGGPPGANAARRADASWRGRPRGDPGEHRGPLSRGRVRGRLTAGERAARGAAETGRLRDPSGCGCHGEADLRRGNEVGSSGSPSSTRRRTAAPGSPSGTRPGIMPTSDGLFLRTATEEEIDRGDVSFEDMQIDHLTARLVREPGRFDVLLLPNLYGDILSDLCAGLVGGLGFIPGRTSGGSTRCSSRCTERAGHRGPRVGEPHRDDPLGRDDAPTPGRDGWRVRRGGSRRRRPVQR